MSLSSIPVLALPLLLLAGCATPPPVVVPASLDPGNGERPTLTLAATGVQIYECRAGAAGAPAWTFVGPEAALFDAYGRSIGQHGAGPYWQADDGSRIVGQVLARADAPLAGAIPWLLLTAQSTGPRGLFSSAAHVQRINTTGGTAPATGCTAAQLGTTVRVPYTADYRLFALSQEIKS